MIARVSKREVPESFTFRLHCAELQREAERKARLAALKVAQDVIRKSSESVYSG
jgi:hypothetical protein